MIVNFLPFHPHLGQPAGLKPLPECVAADDGWTCPRAPGIVTTYTTLSGKVVAIATAIEDQGACKGVLAGLMSMEPPRSSDLSASGAVLTWAIGAHDEYLATFTAPTQGCELRLEVKP